MAIEPCLHSFCHECIYNWTKKSETCPLCRAATKKHMTSEHIDREKRDDLLVKLTKAMREVLDDEKKRLLASIEERRRMVLQSRKKDEEERRSMRL